MGEDRTAVLLSGERRRLSRIYGYSVCGVVLGHAHDGRPMLCALPRRHDSPHLPPRD